MELRRNQMKYFSSDNMRLLSSLILSLSSKQSTMENKLIDYWVPSTAYIKDESMVIYDDAIQICKISNADDTFNQNKWLKLSPEIDELSKSDVKAMLNLSQEEIDNLQKLLKDDQITTTSTFSSSKIFSDLQAAIDTAKEYTNNQLGKAVKPAYKVVSSTSEVTETGYFYLISNGTNYDMYVLSSDGSVVSLGTSEVDLSNYYTKTEVDNDFLKKTDATSTYATITTVDGKVDKTNMLTGKDSSATDDQVYSAKAMNTELDGVVKKTDITTTVDSTSTDDTVPSAKSVYTNVLSLLRNQNMTEEQVNSNMDTFYIATISSDVGKAIGLPISDKIYSKIINIPHGTYSIQLAWDIGKYNNIFMLRKCNGGVWGTWQKVCTTKVADVPVTNITTNLVSTKVALDNSDSYATYYVKSGTCYVTIWSLRLIEACSVETIFNGLPKSTIGVTCPLCNGVESFAQVFMSPNSGVIAFNANASLVNKSGYCSFSYPVAES